MYVRWKRNRWKREDWDAPTYLTAVLVESERRDGKPRQRVIQHLGSIQENRVGQVGARMTFWNSVSVYLTRAHLTAEQEQDIRNKLLLKVDLPTLEQQEMLNTFRVVAGEEPLPVVPTNEADCRHYATEPSV